jgi:hypothetical protein
MYFWKVEELKKKLAAGPLTEREALPYLVLFMATAAATPLTTVDPFNSWDYVETAASIALVIFGTIYAYRCNGGAAGSNFLQRFLAIGWVVVVRLIAMFVLPASFVLAVFVEESNTTWQAALMVIIGEAIYFERIGNHMRSVAGAAAGE